MESQRWSRLRYVVLGALVVVLLAWSGHSAVLRSIGAYLVVQDPLERADVVVVLGGHMPFRALEAAALYHEGWVPKVILTRDLRRREYYTLRALGITIPEERGYNREVLIRRGIPGEAIVMIEQEVSNTREELQSVVNELGKSDISTVIIATSKYHARRTRTIWRYLSQGQPRAIIRWAREDPFDADRWWKHRGFILAVVREYLGLLNYSFGFPLG